MRIIIVSGGAQVVGGAEKMALTSAIKLAERGHQVKLIAANGPVEESLSEVPNLEVQVLISAPYAEGRNLLERTKLVWPKGIGGALSKVLEAEKSGDTLVHFHGGYLELGVPGFRALAQSGLPTLYTHHDYGWACPLTGFYNYTTEEVCPLTGGSLNCLMTDCTNRHLEKLVRYGRHFGTHRSSGIASRVDRHIFVSEFARARLAPYLPAQSCSTVIENGIDAVQSPRIPAKSDSPLLYVGRLTSEKDPLSFAKAAQQTGVDFKIVGEGPMRAQLEQQGFGPHLTGWKSGEELSKLTAGARGWVIASKCIETAGLVVKEAAALGVPTVAPSGSAPAQSIHHECTGLIYDRQDGTSLVRALMRLKDLSYANFLGCEAYRHFWQAPSTWERHLDQLETVYGEVLRGC